MDEVSSATSQDPRVITQKIVCFGKRTHSKKTGIGYKKYSLILQLGQKEWKHETEWGRRD